MNNLLSQSKRELKIIPAQVLGLTSYSRWEGAAELRRCLPASAEAQDLLLETALHRLDRFLHVGIFDRLEDSIAALAATLNISLQGPSWVVRHLSHHSMMGHPYLMFAIYIFQILRSVSEANSDSGRASIHVMAVFHSLPSFESED